MSRNAPPEPGVLLCEGCGYVIDGLPEQGVCPECAKPIADSVPARRVGTPFQRGDGYAATLWAVLRHPTGTLDQMRFDAQARRAALWFRVITLSLSALCVGVLAALAQVIHILSNLDDPGRVAPAIAWALLRAALFIPIAGVVLWGLTWIESSGLVFFGRQRGARMTPGIARTICSHGCAGWLVGAAGATVGLFASLLLNADLAPALVALPALAGLLIFEVFAYLGLQRCRFANGEEPRATHAPPA